MKLGTKVTNDRGWHGTIVNRPSHWGWKCNGPIPLVYVHWKEREEMMNDSGRDSHNIKDPVVSALPENLTIVS